MMRPIFALCLLMVLLPSKGEACSCMPDTPRANMKWADAVFAGTIESAEIIPNSADEFFRESMVVIKFSVKESFKGGAAKSFTLHTTLNRSSCGGILGPIAVGTEWVIFAATISQKGQTHWAKKLGDNQLPTKLYTTALCVGNMVKGQENAAQFEGYLRELRSLK